MNRPVLFDSGPLLRLSLCLFVLWLAMLAQAQTGPGAPGPSRDSIDFLQEPIVYEKVRGVIRYGEDGRGTKESTARIRVQSYAGIQKVGQLIFPYNGANERLEVRSVRVIKPNGDVVTAGGESVLDVSSPVVQEAPMYTDARQKHVSVPGLSVGDILEYDVVTRIFDPLTPGQFWDDWEFASQFICLDEQVELYVPADRALKIKNPQGVEPTTVEAGGQRRYTWKTQNLKVLEIEYPFGKFRSLDPAEMLKGLNLEPPKKLLFSTFQSWDEIGKWYGSLATDWQVATPEVRAKAEELTRNAANQLAKAEAIYEYVSHIRYVSLSFGMGRYQPHSAAEVMTNRYGDCKDKATLLDALLAAEEIPSATVLIHSKGDLDRDIPTPQQFDHAINLVLVDGKELWLDSTLGVAPFRYLLPQLRGKTALVVRFPRKSELRETPVTGSEPKMYRLDIEKKSIESGGEEAQVAVEVRGGDWEVLLRLLLSRITPTQLGQMLSSDSALPGSSYGGTYTDVKTGDPYDASKPIRLEAHYTWKPDPANHLQVLSAAATASSPLAWQVLSRILPMPGTTSEKSMEPIMLDGPKEFSLHLRLDSGPVDDVNRLKPAHARKDFAEYDLEVRSEKGTTTADAHLNIRAKEIPADRKEEYLVFRGDVLSSLAPSIKTKPAASTASSPATGSTGTVTSKDPEKPESPGKLLYDSARRAASNRDYATAAQLYEEAISKDADYADAWNSLGYAYNQLRRYEKGEAALRRALALDPSARFAHGNLGQALEGQKKYAEAILEYQKESDTDPKAQWAVASLGRVQVMSKQYREAIPALEKALSFNPTDPAVYFNLGRAYANTGQTDKATAALKKSVELEPTPARWNWVAYEMANDKLALDQAQKYAESAIAASVLQMREVSLEHISNEDARAPAQITAYWDTLGWVYFQLGKFDEAEKYVSCAWLARFDGELGDHLGQIYEKEGRKADSVQAYELALAANQPVPETRDHLKALLEQDVDYESLTQKARGQLKEIHTLKLKNARNLEGVADFWILLSPGSKVKGVKFISGDEALESYAKELGILSYPDCFPDATEIQFLRRARLSCTGTSPDCRLLFQSAETVRAAN